MIGVFDSGFGGLSILREIVKELPQYSYMYLGDTARVPYGNRSMDTVYEFTKEAVDFLFEQGCELVLIACNTASAEALRRLQREYVPAHYPGKRILGVIVPAAERAVELTKNNRVGVLATEGTVESGTFVRELRNINPTIKVFQQSATLLVPFIEAGEHRSKEVVMMLARYLRPLMSKKIDTLILGCTHYGHMAGAVQKLVGKKVKVVSEGPVVARKLREYLERHKEFEMSLRHKKGLTFYSTDMSKRFQRLGTFFFGRAIVVRRAEL